MRVLGCLDVLSGVDLARCQTVIPEQRGVMHARRGLSAWPPACLSIVRSRSDQPWFMLLCSFLRVRTTVELAVSHMTNTLRYKSVFVSSSVSRFHHIFGDMNTMLIPWRGHWLKCWIALRARWSSKTASPRAPAPLRTRACPSSALGGSPAGHPSSRCCSRSVFPPTT